MKRFTAPMTFACALAVLTLAASTAHASDPTSDWDKVNKIEQRRSNYQNGRTIYTYQTEQCNGGAGYFYSEGGDGNTELILKVVMMAMAADYDVKFKYVLTGGNCHIGSAYILR